MTAESILERINQKPFRPIALKTVGGTWIEIDSAQDIFIYDRTKATSVVLFDPAGRKFIYKLQAILHDGSTGLEFMTDDVTEAQEMRAQWLAF